MINPLDEPRHTYIVNMFLTTSSSFGLSASSFWTGISFETKLYVVTTTSKAASLRSRESKLDIVIRSYKISQFNVD